MRAAVFSRRGPSDVLSVQEVPDLEPGPAEVRVKIAVSGVNPTDWKMRKAGADLTWPHATPNQDGAGVIDAVGTGVSPDRIGERVWLTYAAWQRPWGTAAEQCVVPSEHAWTLPDNISFAQGAGLPIPFLTAHYCLYADGPIAGLTVLVAGGAGAVGHAAIQIAKLGGAQVITTVSGPAKAAIAQTANPDLIVNYRDADAEQQIKAFAPEGVDRIVEVALTDNLALDLAVLKPFGSVVTYANQPEDPAVPVRQLMFGNFNLRFVIMYFFDTEVLNHAVGDVTKYLAEGRLVALPELHFTLEQTGAAHDAVECNAVGKVLIDIAEL
jgi:NADPH2:quinone reductase